MAAGVRHVALAVVVLGAATAISYLSALAPLASLAALASIVLAILVVTQPRALLLLLAASLPWEGWLNFPSETVSVVKILGLLLFASVILGIARGEQRLYLPSTGLAVVVFGLTIALSLIVSVDASAGTGKLLRYGLFIAFFFIVVELVDDRRWLLRLLATFTLSVVGAAAIGLLLFLSGEEPLASGPITDPNDYGYVLATTVPILVYLIIEDRPRRWLWVSVLPVILAAMFATLSRSVLTALAAIAIWALLTRRVSMRAVIATACAGVVLVAASAALWSPLIDERIEQKGAIASENVASRQSLWNAAVAMAMDRPLTGVGPDRFGVESVDYVRDNPVVLAQPVTHNTYLEILAESGPIALAAFLWFLVASWMTLRRTERHTRALGDRTIARLAAALQACLLAAAIAALFLSEQLASPFWLIGGLAATLPRIALGDAESMRREPAVTAPFSSPAPAATSATPG